MHSPKEFAAWLAASHPLHNSVVAPQLANCKVVVVVPVRGEQIGRIERLIKSLKRQQVAPGTIELLLVVNNRKDDGSQGWQAQYSANQHLLTSPLLKAEGVHAIDLSSSGLCTADSNVGSARQRGLLEAAYRFAARGTNGIVVHTDADCVFEDPTFFGRLIWVFDHNPTLVAAAGGHTLEVSLDDPEAPNLAALAPAYVLIRRYSDMYGIIRDGKVPSRHPYLLGSCAIHRAFEGVLAGGFEPVGLLEDVLFGEALERYAAQEGLSTDYTNRWDLNVTTAFRLSDRTENANTKRYLAMVGTGERIMVDDVFSPDTDVLLDDTYLERMCAAVAAIPGGQNRLEYLFVSSPMARLRIAQA